MYDNFAKPPPPRLGLPHGVLALLAMAYAVGSPNVAPMLPLRMERAFASLHHEFNEAGAKALRSASGAMEHLSALVGGA